MGNRGFGLVPFRGALAVFSVWAGVAWVLSGTASGDAPAPSPQIRLRQVIARFHADLNATEAIAPGSTGIPRSLAAGLEAALDDYGAAGDMSALEDAARRLEWIWRDLSIRQDASLAELRGEFRAWLLPRRSVFSARRMLLEAVGEAGAGVPEETAETWRKFVSERFDPAFRDLENAATVEARFQAVRSLNRIRDDLRELGESSDWSPAAGLLSALDGWFGVPNVHAVATTAALAPVFDQNLVTDGPVYQRGQTSYVTAGPKVGFGLYPNPRGLTFYNQQRLSSYTPVQGFQRELESDQRGRLLGLFYGFELETFDRGELTVTGTVSADGLRLWSDATHDVRVRVASRPQPTLLSAAARPLLGAAGFNQRRITDLVQENALDQVRREIPAESDDERSIRIGQQEDEQNRKLGEFLVGEDTFRIGNLKLSQLRLQTEWERATGRGLFQWNNADEQSGALFAPPVDSGTDAGALTFDLNLISVGGNLLRGLLRNSMFAPKESLMLEILPADLVPAGESAVTVTRDADDEAFLEALDRYRNERDSRGFVLRLFVPDRGPEFAMDAEGRLVGVLRDFLLEVPAPPGPIGQIVGGNAKYFQVRVPRLELIGEAIGKAQGADEDDPPVLRIRLLGAEIDPKWVITPMDGPDKPGRRLSAIVTGLAANAASTQVKDREFNIPIRRLIIPGFRLEEVSALDATGWIRLRYEPTGERISIGGE